MYLSEIHNIKPSNPVYKQLDGLLFLSKNLYNKALYTVRQEFITSSKLKAEGKLQVANYLNYYAVNRLLIDSKDVDYNSLPRKVSNQVLMGLDKNWRSFFASVKDWKVNKDKYKGKPSLPKYKHKTKGRNTLVYELQTISKKSLKRGFIKLSGLDFEIPFINNKSKLIEVKIKKANNNLNIEIHITYERKEKELITSEPKNILGIDLGVNNLMTLTSNVFGFVPKIVNGRPLKSINQFYAKKLGYMKSELPSEYKNVWNKDLKMFENKLVQVPSSKRIKLLTSKRNMKVKDYLHKVSKFVVEHCLLNNIDTLVVGLNKQWKTKVELGDKGNQNFCSIPYNTLIHMLEYKCKLEGLRFTVREESYTSVASFVDNDYIPTYGLKDYTNNIQFSGKRVHRGLYQTSSGKLVNADVNGSLNIIRKEFPNAFIAKGIEGVAAVHPMKVKINI